MNPFKPGAAPVRLRFALSLFLAIVLFAGPAVGQSPNGTISGLVLDPSGRTIAGADILIANDATGLRYSGATNSEGIYAVPNLSPGDYRIQVSKVGFKTIIKPDIVLKVQDALAINFTLPVGATSETVTVEGGAPLLNTETASVSTVIDRSFVESLPLNGRSFNTLLQLTPGVVIAPANNLQTPGQFSIAGQRTDANNFTVDGVSANFGVGAGTGQSQSGTGTAQAFSAIGGTSSLVSVDALQEFRVETSSFAPEFGRTPGGQVVLSTRSGTNDFHGGAFDYFRNTIMDANDWFADQAGQPRAAEHHNDFGGFLGGPILKDKSFFFVSYEGARLDLPQTQVVPVPSDYARSIVPATAAPFIEAYPLPDNRPVTPGVYVGSFTGTYSNRATLNAASVRIDHTLSNRFSVFGRYDYAPSKTATRQDSLSEIVTSTANTQTLTVGVDMALSNTLSNTLRGNYSTQQAGSVFSMDSFGGARPLDPGLLLDTLPLSQNEAVFLSLDLPSYAIGAGANNHTSQFNLVDGLARSMGSHLIKIGVDYRAIVLDEKPAEHGIDALATDVQSFVSPGTAGQVLLVTGLEKTSKILTQAFSIYGQDTWRVSRKFTMTYGLRWELSPAPSPLGTTALASWINTDDPSKIALAPAGAPLWQTSFTNFAPRLGVAYSPTEKGDFVIRAGGGIFYDIGVGQAAILGSQFPNTAVGFFPGVTVPIDSVALYIPSPASLQPPYPSGVYAFAHNLKPPRSYQWNVALEKSFVGKQVVSLTYVGQSGRDLLRQTALFQPNPNFSGSLLFDQNDAHSNYEALQMQYRRPISSHVQAILNYTWSHSLDNSSNDVIAGLPNAVISGANDYASSDFDVRHSASGALAVSLPRMAGSGTLSRLTRDWLFDVTMVARTGFPFNAILRSTSPDPGGFASSRPDRVPGQPLWISDASAGGGKSLNPEAFSVPTTIRQGTEKRNDIPGFGLFQSDISLGRRVPLTDRLAIQFRADAFNFLNHPNFTNPTAQLESGPTALRSQQMLNQGLGGLIALFQEGGPRSLQLSLKLLF
jgi:hypothetical protein